MKVCPRCAEDVKAAALVCRYCGHEFAEDTPAPQPPPGAPETPTVAPVFYPQPAAEVFRLRPRSGQRVSYRDVILTVDAQSVTFAGERTEAGLVRLYWRLMLGSVGVVLLGLLGLGIASSQFQGESASAVFGVLALGLLVVGIIAPISVAIWFATARRRRVESYSVVLPRASVTGARSAYDWDLGCGLMILLALIPGLIIMLALGKRVVRVNAGFDPSVNPRGRWALNTDSVSAQRLVMLLGGR